MKRAIYYDDCRDAVRLAREWTRIYGSDNLSVEYQTDIGKFAYTITRTAGATLHQWLWMASQSMVCFDAYYMFKKNMAAPNEDKSSFGIMFNSIDFNNYSYVFKTDSLYFERRIAGVPYYKYWSLDLTNNIWYAVRVRKNLKDVRAKIWQYGTVEPDWQYTQTFPAPTGSNENPVNFQPRGGSKFGIATYLCAVGDWAKISDIRITPIPRTGGP